MSDARPPPPVHLIAVKVAGVDARGAHAEAEEARARGRGERVQRRAAQRERLQPPPRVLRDEERFVTHGHARGRLRQRRPRT